MLVALICPSIYSIFYISLTFFTVTCCYNCNSSVLYHVYISRVVMIDRSAVNEGSGEGETEAGG